MIILDTNVVSEPLRPRASAAVIDWLDSQPAEALFVTAISVAELWAGIAVLAEGARRSALESSLEELLVSLFADRRLPFDDRAARAYASIVQRARSKGQTLPLADGLIAAIALARGFAVATRDRGPFETAGVQVLDPWSGSR
jgi:predicted nucleic acid-binding protein